MSIYWISYYSRNNLIPNIFDEKLTEYIAENSKDAWEKFKQENPKITKDFIENKTQGQKIINNISKIKTLSPFVFNVNNDDIVTYEKESYNGIIYEQYFIMRSKWHVEDVIKKKETQKEIFDFIFSLLNNETAKEQLSEEKRKNITNYILNGFIILLRNIYKGKQL